MSEPVSVGFIGLGNMGRPMASHLLGAGHEVRGFDISMDARDAFAGIGGLAVDTAARAAEADVVILMLPDSRVVTAVMGDPAVQAAVRPGSVVIDMSSSEPLVTRELASSLAARDVVLLDAPVSGGVKGATSGNLTIMVGGERRHVDAARPILELFGRVAHAGETGSGHAVKALNNLLSAVHLWASSEAIEVGMRFGLDPTVMLEIINGSSGRSASTENKWPNFILPGTFDTGFGLRLMLKDMRIAASLGEQVGLRLALGEAAVERWAEAADDLPPMADHTEVAKWIAAHASV